MDNVNVLLERAQKLSENNKEVLITKEVKLMDSKGRYVMDEDGIILIPLQISTQIAMEELFIKYGFNVSELISQAADTYGMSDHKAKKTIESTKEETKMKALSSIKEKIANILDLKEEADELLQACIVNTSYKDQILGRKMDICRLDKYEIIMLLLSDENGGGQFRKSQQNTRKPKSNRATNKNV